MHRQDEIGRLAEMQAQTLEALSRYSDRILTDPAEMMAEAILLVRLSRCFPDRWALLNAAVESGLFDSDEYYADRLVVMMVPLVLPVRTYFHKKGMELPEYMWDALTKMATRIVRGIWPDEACDAAVS